MIYTNLQAKDYLMASPFMSFAVFFLSRAPQSCLSSDLTFDWETQQNENQTRRGRISTGRSTQLGARLAINAEIHSAFQSLTNLLWMLFENI